MGIEYRHYLVVNEADWCPKPDTAARVDSVIREWSIVDELEKVVNLALGANNTELEDMSITVPPGPGLAFVYSGVKGASVDRIAGASIYDDVTTAERYTMKTTLVIGDDYRVQWSSESIYFEVVSPPIANAKPVLGDDDEEPYGMLFAKSFPSTGVTSPPVVVAHVEKHARPNVASRNCQGYWRGGLIIDFGKDLPSFTDDVHMLASRDFVTAISEAFRGSIVEVGEFY
jgi:hypothetical protein